MAHLVTDTLCVVCMLLLSLLAVYQELGDRPQAGLGPLTTDLIVLGSAVAGEWQWREKLT